jgi:hypothetical protein
MAKYSVQGPDGKVYVLEGPDGASQADVLKAAQSLAQSHQAQAAKDYAAMKDEFNPTNGMSTAELVAAGIGKGMTDLARGAKERFQQAFGSPTMSSLVTGEKPEDAIAESRRLDAPLMATTAGKTGNIVGKVAASLPTVLIPGANTLAGAALIGGAQGALEPTTADESVLKNIAVGGAGGAGGYAAGKLIGATVKGARAAAEPFYEAGQQRIVGRALNSAAGSDAAAVRNRLAEAAQPFVGPSQPGLARNALGELVPGSVPTVGQAAQNAGVASMERAATATNPAVTNQVANRLSAQNSARVNVLQDMAGQGGERDMAVAARDATSDQLYGAARANGINPAALAPDAQANIAAMQARIPQGILDKAKSLAKISGSPMDDTTSVEGLHYVKMALDDAISSAKASGSKTEARALTKLQQDFLQGMDAMSPDYAAARTVHAQMSAPINQMDVAQRLVDKSVNPLTGTLQPAAYARSLNDGTAAAATGLPGATLEGTMTNQQGNLLQSILADLQRSNAANNAGRGVGSDTVQKLAYTNLLDQAGVPTFLREFKPAQVVGNIATRVGDAAYARQNRELSNRLAELMLSPQDASQAMGAAARYDQPNRLLQLLAPYLAAVQRGTAPAGALTMSR